MNESEQLSPKKSHAEERVFALVSQPKQTSAMTQSERDNELATTHTERQKIAIVEEREPTIEAEERSQLSADADFRRLENGVNRGRFVEEVTNASVAAIHTSSQGHEFIETVDAKAEITKTVSDSAELISKNNCKNEQSISRDLWLKKMDENIRNQSTQSERQRSFEYAQRSSGSSSPLVDDRVYRDMEMTLAYQPKNTGDSQKITFDLDAERMRMEQWAQEQERLRQVSMSF